MDDKALEAFAHEIAVACARSEKSGRVHQMTYDAAKAGARAAIAAYEAETGWRVALEFHPGDEIPDVPRGQMKACVIMMRSKHTGKNFTQPAYYLNGYPLEFEDGCGDSKCEDEHEDGCPVTGWFYDNANFEYENCYYRIEGECLAWALIPASADIEAAVPLPEQEPRS